MPPAAAPSPRPSRSRRTGKRRRKKQFPLSLWQGLILLGLICCLVFAHLSLNQADENMKSLRADRENARIRYENEVARHQVKYREWIEYYAALYELDPAFVAAIIKTESDYDPYAVSSKNAQGLMQFMPDTFEWIAPKFDIDAQDMAAINNPENAIKMGCWLLHYITEQFNGDPILTACAYHAGWGNVEGWIEKYSSNGKTLTLAQIPYDNTRNYARKVLNSYAIYQQHYY